MLQQVLKELCQQDNYFLLDLDNTLYDEKQYLYPAYHAIAKKLASGYSLNEIELTNFLIKAFEEGGREKLFDRMCEKYQIPQSAIPEMLSTMRDLKLATSIELYPKAKLFIEKLIAEKKTVFIVTNGNLRQQQNKVNSISWGESFPHLIFIYTALFQPKPNRASFDYLVKEYSLSPEKCVMIGDSIIDEEFAGNCGIRFLQSALFSNQLV